MKFYLVDRVLELDPGRRIVTVKNLTLAEEYLADHFPAYPVLPGVMMLEALVQSAAWLVHEASGFARPLVLLKEARNVRYGNFLRPGGQLVCEVEAKAIGEAESKMTAVGRSDGQTCVQARLTLEHRTVAEEDPGLGDLDAALRAHLRDRFELIGGPRAVEAGGATSA